MAMPNYINEMQEHLQAGAPALGCRPEMLWKWDVDRLNEQSFRFRVVLLHTVDPSGTWTMPWGEGCVGKKLAKQDAARRALVELRRTHSQPHDASSIPLAVAVAARSSGVGSVETGFNDLAIVEAATLPELDDDLLGIIPVVCSARQRGVHITAEAGATTLGEYLLTFGPSIGSGDGDGDGDGGGGGGGSLTRPSRAHRAIFSTAPPNLGKLGEEFAAAWLRRQPFVAPESVRWLNCDNDAAEDHDLECEPLADPGRRHIEVKTRWRKCRHTMSSRQLQRLLDPDDDYMLLVVGNFYRVFDDKGPFNLPDIRVLHSPNSRSGPAHAHVATSSDVVPDRTAGNGAVTGEIVATTNEEPGDTISYAACAASVARASSPKRSQSVSRLEAGQVSGQLRLKSMRFDPTSNRRQSSSISASVVSEAEGLLDCALDPDDHPACGALFRLRFDGSNRVPEHIVEFATRGGPGGPDLLEVRRQWRLNRKRLCRLADGSGSTDPVQLASEMLLQLSAEIAGMLQPQGTEIPADLAISDGVYASTGETRIDPADGRAYPLQSFLEEYGTHEGLARWQSVGER